MSAMSTSTMMFILRMMSEDFPTTLDDVAVDAFACEMKRKLERCREKGRGGWDTATPMDLSTMLRDHVEKGDPVDVANFCMFLWYNNYMIMKQEN